jgi:hypothetical protein
MKDNMSGLRKKPKKKIKDNKKRFCLNCGEDISNGGHFVPPCFGDKGMFICEKKLKIGEQ